MRFTNAVAYVASFTYYTPEERRRGHLQTGPGERFAVLCLGLRHHLERQADTMVQARWNGFKALHTSEERKRRG